MLGTQCSIGQQRVPGRPRRKQPAKSSIPTSQNPSVNASTLPISPPLVRPNTFFNDEWGLWDRAELLYPILSPPEKPSTTTKDVTATPCGFIDVFHQSDTSWVTSDDTEFSDTPLYANMDTVWDIYRTTTSPTMPLAINDSFSLSNCLTTNHPRNTEPKDIMTDLSTINLGLYTRLEAIKKNGKTLNFDMMISQCGPLFIDNITLLDYIIKVAQEFFFLLTNLYDERHCPSILHNVQPMEVLCPCHLSLRFLNEPRVLFQVSLPLPTVIAEPLPAPVALIIASVFIQLITIYELILNNVATVVERLTIYPMEYVPVLIVCGRKLERPCTQGMIFCEVTVSLIENIERVLGVARKEVGLLSQRQVEVLRDELDERCNVIPGHNVMTPTMLRKLYGKVANILRNIG
ncbi:hypothetical protein FGSG_10576 [Fusarium graminearum PH-1]|uniref:Chromosome 1, complete genome n=1 Tax=Gibberella zeae (strain ATCC MYA-4620 / CBS 123657 / FGSC 9075 / NRRL 31084 / PH-1) TaxID=229533 RepID=I1S1H4_GIBZE|nr:hypothetical protein FGSG_10576 [Fusarium graminearum PH-1]ESU17313.1 hypothetical protein FGSG_10576 [Fusarium graminearum PH-1]CEF76026.1 unnamed protein product [Fusarium graminearum]|eukprot:XP_011319575.1 hypothetical protein FGSG_10576 [Fusarium graminearum PH-1]